MANNSYPKGMQKLLSATIDFAGDTIKVCLLPNTYTYSAAHEFVSDLGSRIGTDQVLTNKSVAGGVFDADDVDFGTLAPGSTLKAIAVYKDTGNPTTSPLLFYMDQLAGFPMETNGGAVTVPWEDGPKKIARITAPFYPKGAEKTLSGGIAWGSDSIKAALVPNSYSYDAGHEFLSAVGVPLGIVALSNRSVTNGAFDADDADFGAMAGPGVAGAIVLFKDTADAATSPLLLHIAGVVGFPHTLNGGGLKVVWPDSASKVFSLVPA